jgi:hypothetical protein
MGWTWPETAAEAVRPMSNCLRPTGIPRSAYQTGRNHPGVESVPHSNRDAMPSQPGSVICASKGVCRLLNDELAKGLGVPKIWLQDTYPDRRSVRNTVALHVLTALTPLLIQITAHAPLPPGTSDAPTFVLQPGPNDEAFSWVPPDLSIGSDWNKKRVKNLISACCQYLDPGSMIEAGMLALKHHRSNYMATHPNPTYLQILWWEFPLEHWDNLRDGSPMNFLREPRRGHTPNSDMTEEQICIGEEFIDELVDLGVLVQVPLGVMISNGPIFCLPKPCQPGQ